MTLVELLVATVIVSVVLSAAYGWLWNVSSLARSQDDRAQAGTIAAAAARILAEDIRAALAVAPAPAGRDPSRSLLLLHDHVDVAPEPVLIVWDPARGVLWRNASGTYVADHVSSLRLQLLLRDGRFLDPAAMATADWRDVVAVHAEVAAAMGSVAAVRALTVPLGSG
jgi:prepilin-type N-terminal cleavage/methylation domain-containing protein